MRNWAASALAFSSVGLFSPGAFAAWDAGDSALVGTTALAVIGLVLAVLLSLRGQKERAARDREREAYGNRRRALGEALTAAGIGVLHWRSDAPPDSPPTDSVGGLRLDGSVGDLVHADDRAALSEAFAAMTGSHAETRLTCRAADGERSLEIVGSVDPAGRKTLVVRDDTECQRAVAALETEVGTLRAEARRLGTVLDVLELPIWVRDGELAIDWCNRAYAAAVDAPDADAAKGVELVANLPPEQRRAQARQANEAGSPERSRRHVVVNGERRLYEIIEAPGPGSGTIGWARDLTDVEKALGDLRQHTEAHDQVLEALNTAIAIYAPDTRLTFYNSEFGKLFQLDESWLAGEPTLGEVLEALRENRRVPEQADWRVFKASILDLFTSVTEPQEALVHLPDGSTLRQIISPHPFGGLLFMTQDVTDRLALERRYSTLTAVQNATLDNLYEAVAVFGGDGRLKLSNPGYAEMWALNPETLEDEPHIGEILDRTRDLIADGQDWIGYRTEQIAKISERRQSTTRLERRDQRVLDCAYVPLPDGATLITYIDVTDSFQVERALRERTEALETADRLKSEFIANVSYELRTPLNTVIGFTEILANQYFGPLNERQNEYIKGILDSSQSLLSLINDILDLATVEAGLMVLEIESLDVHATLVSMLGLVQERARKKQLELALECERSIDPIEADERRVKQVIFNLLSNAIKFTPAGGTITIGADRSDEMVAVWVSDTGVGIDREEQNVVFDKFEQANNALARQTGTGLGLSLVKNFVELHGGSVALESVPQQGTTVTCYFPLRQRNESAPAEREAS
jgi:signal transduction histidine kinase